MKKLIPLFLLFLLASCKKGEFIPNLVKEFSIQSTTNGTSYTIKIAFPDNFNTSQKYAAVYVLDGDDNFSFVAEKCKNISNDQRVSNVLVVSIGYGNDRAVDYTPTDANEGDGGAEDFMLFIKNDLIPEMENNYNADTARNSRIILGHSFGGLFAAYAFTKFNEVFGNYIMLSPSIWYDNEITLKLEQDNRNSIKDKQHLVFMGIGELENSGRMFAPYMAFYQRLKNNYSSMKISSHLESQVDHNGSKKPNIVEGLKFYFENK